MMEGLPLPEKSSENKSPTKQYKYISIFLIIIKISEQYTTPSYTLYKHIASIIVNTMDLYKQLQLNTEAANTLNCNITSTATNMFLSLRDDNRFVC